MWDIVQDLHARGLTAWEAFAASRQGRPYRRAQLLAEGENAAKQRGVEECYDTPEILEKYRRAPGNPAAS